MAQVGSACSNSCGSCSATLALPGIGVPLSFLDCFLITQRLLYPLATLFLHFSSAVRDKIPRLVLVAPRSSHFSAFASGGPCSPTKPPQLVPASLIQTREAGGSPPSKQNGVSVWKKDFLLFFLSAKLPGVEESSLHALDASRCCVFLHEGLVC